MSIFEYDKELEEKKLRKAEFEAGFAEGSLSTSIETARRMLHSGKFSLEEISVFSGLPLEEVKSFRKKLQTLINTVSGASQTYAGSRT